MHYYREHYFVLPFNVLLCLRLVYRNLLILDFNVCLEIERWFFMSKT